jgi:hypothetical protein
MSQAIFLFKLRSNIDLEGDLALARRELESLLPEVWPVRDVDEMVRRHPVLGELRGGAAICAHLRPGGVWAYWSRAPMDFLPTLVRRLTFIQTVYVILQEEPPGAALDGIENVVSIHRSDEGTLLVAVPHYALMELADIVARRSGEGDIEDDLDGLLAYVLGSEPPGRVRCLGDLALAAKITSGLLTHDLHYYKAKFFPRLARAVLNICCAPMDVASPRVLDPFVGSGTTLLEAALLGMASEGLDIDPLSVLIAEQKLAALHLDVDAIDQQAAHLLEAASVGQGGGAFDLPPRLIFPLWLLRKFGGGQKYSAQELEIIQGDIQIAQAAIQGCDPAFRPLFSVMLSDAIARKLRFRFLGTGVGRFSLSVTRRPLLASLEANVGHLRRKLRAWAWLKARLGLALAPAAVCQGDARDMQEKVRGPYHIVLTSPPYLPAASGRESYARSRAPSLLALRLATPGDVDALDGHAVGTMEGNLAVDALTPGARELVLWLRGDPMRAIKAAPTSRYFLDMRQALREIRAVLTPGGCAAVVTGKRSIFYRFSTREILFTAESAELLAEEATLAGFEVVESIDLALRKANVNARPRSLDDYYETILMLRKSPL